MTSAGALLTDEYSRTCLLCVSAFLAFRPRLSRDKACHHEEHDDNFPLQRHRAVGGGGSNVVRQNFRAARTVFPVRLVQVIEDSLVVPATVLPPTVRTCPRRWPSRLLRFLRGGFFHVVLLEAFAEKPHVDCQQRNDVVQ